MSFAHLHVHTGFSFHASPIRIEDLAQRCHELGYSSCAITDSNTLAGAIRFDHAARSLGIVPIFGCELTLLSNESDDHIVVLARDLEGYSNLCRLVTCAQAHGRTHPGLTLEQLAPMLDTLSRYMAVPRACFISLSQHTIHARHAFCWKRCAHSFQTACTWTSKIPCSPTLRASCTVMRCLSDETGISACATGGVTHLRRVDAEVREMLLAIGSLEDVDTHSRHTKNVNAENWFRGADEMAELFFERGNIRARIQRSMPVYYDQNREEVERLIREYHGAAWKQIRARDGERGYPDQGRSGCETRG